MSSPSRILLREIAAQAGVSRMAVSLALRGRPGVSETTRKKVRRIARRMGYEPDPEVAKLMSHIRAKAPAETKACLALLTSGPAPQAWRSSVTERKYVEGARARAREYGYRIEEFWLDEPGMSQERTGSIIWNRGIEGVIVAPLQGKLTSSKPRSIAMDFSPFSAVEISETVDRPDLDRAIHDQYTSMLKVIAELRRAGYRKPGLVLEEALDLRTNGKWRSAYLGCAIAPPPGALPPPLILAAPDQRPFDRWLDRHRPDAVISVDRLGIRMLLGRGLKIPRDIGYASLDLDGDAEEFPGLSGIDQNSRLVGAAAVDLLVASIQRGHRGIPEHPVRIEVEGIWRAGSTTRPRKRFT